MKRVPVIDPMSDLLGLVVWNTQHRRDDLDGKRGRELLNGIEPVWIEAADVLQVGQVQDRELVLVVATVFLGLHRDRDVLAIGRQHRCAEWRMLGKIDLGNDGD